MIRTARKGGSLKNRRTKWKFKVEKWSYLQKRPAFTKLELWGVRAEGVVTRNFIPRPVCYIDKDFSLGEMQSSSDAAAERVARAESLYGTRRQTTQDGG